MKKNGKTTKKEEIKLTAEELNIGFQVWEEEKESHKSSFITPPN
jgi:hypothetical protein